MARLAAEHFWPACPNADFTKSLIAASRSALRRNHQARFCPTFRRTSAATGANSETVARFQSSRSELPRPRAHRKSKLCRLSPSSHGKNCKTSSRHARLPQLARQQMRRICCFGRGFQNHAVARDQSRQHAAARNRVGKIPRRRHHNNAQRRSSHVARHGVHRVITREIYRLAHFGVAFGHGFFWRPISCTRSLRNVRLPSRRRHRSKCRRAPRCSVAPNRFAHFSRFAKLRLNSASGGKAGVFQLSIDVLQKPRAQLGCVQSESGALSKPDSTAGKLARLRTGKRRIAPAPTLFKRRALARPRIAGARLIRSRRAENCLPRYSHPNAESDKPAPTGNHRF